MFRGERSTEERFSLAALPLALPLDLVPPAEAVEEQYEAVLDCLRCEFVDVMVEGLRSLASLSASPVGEQELSRSHAVVVRLLDLLQQQESATLIALYCAFILQRLAGTAEGCATVATELDADGARFDAVLDRATPCDSTLHAELLARLCVSLLASLCEGDAAGIPTARSVVDANRGRLDGCGNEAAKSGDELTRSAAARLLAALVALPPDAVAPAEPTGIPPEPSFLPLTHLRTNLSYETVCVLVGSVLSACHAVTKHNPAKAKVGPRLVSLPPPVPLSLPPCLRAQISGEVWAGRAFARFVVQIWRAASSGLVVEVVCKKVCARTNSRWRAPPPRPPPTPVRLCVRRARRLWFDLFLRRSILR